MGSPEGGRMGLPRKLIRAFFSLMAIAVVATLIYAYTRFIGWHPHSHSQLWGYDAPLQQHQRDARRIAVILLVAKRPLAVESHLHQLVRKRPSAEKFPIFVSQDGNDREVGRVVKEFVHAHEEVHHLHFEWDPVGWNKSQYLLTYAHLSRNHKYALDTVFVELGFELAIVNEDDLDIADDFFSYFASASQLLYTDPTVWFISAFNDNGAAADPEKVERLYRSDFFPNYGFMLRRELWVDELAAIWDLENWDRLPRKPAVMKGRVCIRPEVPRTLHNMTLAGNGTNSNEYKAYFQSTFLPSRPVDFSSVDMRRLEKGNYDAELVRLLRNAKPIAIKELLANYTDDGAGLAGGNATTSFRVVYKDPEDYAKLAATFALMGDFNAGMPRAAYYGVVIFTAPGSGSTIYAVHPNTRLGEEPHGQEFGSQLNSRLYDPSWDKLSTRSRYIWIRFAARTGYGNKTNKA